MVDEGLRQLIQGLTAEEHRDEHARCAPFPLVGEGWDGGCRRTIVEGRLAIRRGTKHCLVRSDRRSCGVTPHPAAPRFAALTKAPHPSPTRGEEMCATQIITCTSVRLF